MFSQLEAEVLIGVFGEEASFFLDKLVANISAVMVGNFGSVKILNIIYFHPQKLSTITIFMHSQELLLIRCEWHWLESEQNVEVIADVVQNVDEQDDHKGQLNIINPAGSLTTRLSPVLN